MSNYDHDKIEKKWQERWRKEEIYKDYTRPKKFYALDMFPYPSGAGLHVGHPKGYIATDVFSRYKMLQGYSVLHPMGWDAFGLPAENYAIVNKIHPRVAVEQNITTFKKQLEKFGFTYDWEREINTTDPEYYKWTQWAFLKMFEKGLAYQSDEAINWCPKCQTGLALEDLEGGVCERCGTEVEQKKMRQWVLKMTAYADRLLYDLDKEKLNWEEAILEQQRNWIGRSEGAQFKMAIVGSEEKLEVFTTRLDTVFGMTFALIAPEHNLVQKLKPQIKNWSEVEKYIDQAQKKTDLQRQTEIKKKTGVELKGVKVINPFTKKEISLFASDFVLASYGTGAVMAVPSHDSRDWDFADKYRILKIQVIDPVFEENISVSNVYPSFIPSTLKGETIEDATKRWRKQELERIKKGERCFTDDGVLINSGEYNGLASAEARKKMIKWLEKEKIGQSAVNYKMRDWVFSRQRYWGEPIPIVHCEKCGAVAVPYNELPLKLPEVEQYEPTGTGEGPLVGISEWVNTKCPKCGGPGKRETNTMPQWAGSSWYYLRYIDPKNKQALVDKQKEKDWMPVDLYVGGAEHATRHLLYARFWHKFLYDIGAVSTPEPFKRLVHVGLIQAEDGRKMSKRWDNVINPDDVIEQYGADSIRLYEMFMGPFTQNISWSTKSVVGVKRFLDRTWNCFFADYTGIFINDEDRNKWIKGEAGAEGVTSHEIEVLLNKTIKKVSEDIENLKFNTAISQLMVLGNSFYKVGEKERIPLGSSLDKYYSESINGQRIKKSDFEKFVILLAPFAPHMAEELWSNLGHDKSIFTESWPEYDPALIKEDTIQLPVQVNGKVRAVLSAPADISEEEAKKLALSDENVKKWLEGKEPKKVIFVKGRLLNLLV
ncbi:MAG: leucine--tRNA ligase [Candidatus Portnoybacteria bacterium]|nr:leucine--tRNA ligase [Candidatus Portnoybacteria bacterium]